MDNTEEMKNISKEKTKKKKEKPVRVKKVKSAKPAKAPKPKKEKAPNQDLPVQVSHQISCVRPLRSHGCRLVPCPVYKEFQHHRKDLQT